ncbi:MAG: hypothetical protein AAGA77_07880 [Bacteroidota bacterium]
MSLSHSNGERSKTKLIVVSKKNGKFFVKFPRLEVLVEMTAQYFQELIASGRYSVQYDVNFAIH